MTDSIDDQTILLVMVDHGMTRSGDHGGDSKDEVMAGLFIYTKKKLFRPTMVTLFVVMSVKFIQIPIYHMNN